MFRILVIENDESLGWLLEKILHRYEVVKMTNAMDAWTWLVDGNHCDLIITDINMPHLDGIEFLEILKTSLLYGDTPVIMVSALEDKKAECLRMGADAYLVKPFEPQNLLTVVSNALSRQNQIKHH